MNKLIALFFVVSGVSVLAGCAGSSGQEVNSYLSQGGLPMDQGDNAKSTHHSSKRSQTTTAKSESEMEMNSAKPAAEQR